MLLLVEKPVSANDTFQFLFTAFTYFKSFYKKGAASILRHLSVVTKMFQNPFKSDWCKALSAIAFQRLHSSFAFRVLYFSICNIFYYSRV